MGSNVKSKMQRGLCFLGLFVGMVIAILSDPIWRRNYARLERNRQNGYNHSDKETKETQSTLPYYEPIHLGEN
jgi:hypothetical protein